MIDPAPEKELARAGFTRPVVTLDSRKAVAELSNQQQQPDNHIWLCGAYMADKVPLLDAAVDSALAVASVLGVQPPWQPA